MVLLVVGLWNDPKYSFGVKDTDLNGQSVSTRSSTKANSKGDRGDIEIASFIVNVVPYCKTIEGKDGKVL